MDCLSPFAGRSKPDKIKLYYFGLRTCWPTRTKQEMIFIKAEQGVPVGHGRGCEWERPLGDPGIIALFVLS